MPSATPVIHSKLRLSARCDTKISWNREGKKTFHQARKDSHGAAHGSLIEHEQQRQIEPSAKGFSAANENQRFCRSSFVERRFEFREKLLAHGICRTKGESDLGDSMRVCDRESHGAVRALCLSSGAPTITAMARSI